MDDQSNNAPDNDWWRAEELATHAHALYDEGRLTEAAEQLQAAIELYPYHSAWHFNLGLTYEAMDDADAACDSFRTALDLDGGDVECLNCLAGSLTRRGDFKEALACYAKIDEIDDKFEASYCNRIATYTEMGDHANAELAFYMARQMKDHCSVCSYNLGSSFFLQGRYDEAVLSWREALRIEPGHLLANVRLAEVSWIRGDVDQSRDYYRAQLRVTGEDVDIRLDYADLLIEIGALSESQYHVSLTEKFEPENPGVHICMGDLARARDDMDSAEAHYRHAIALNVAMASGYGKLARVVLAKGQPGEVEGILTQGLRHVPVGGPVLYDYSQVFLAAGVPHQAYALLLQLLDFAPMDAAVWHNMAVACFQLGWVPEGILYCRHALRLRPNYPLARYNLAVGYAANGQLRRARAQVRRGLRDAPDHAELVPLNRQLRRRYLTDRLKMILRRLIGRR